MQHVASEVKHKLPTSEPQNPSYIPNVSVSLGCSWKNVWQSSKGAAATIAENPSRVLDVVQKWAICSNCTKIQTKRDEGKVSFIEYLVLWSFRFWWRQLLVQGSMQIPSL